MSKRNRYQKGSKKYSNKLIIILVITCLALIFGVTGSIFPAHSRLLFGLSLFIIAILLIEEGVFLFWLSWIKPIDSDLLRKRYRMMKTSLGHLSWLWLLPESLFPAYTRMASIIAILIGLFLLIMVIDHFVLGHQSLVINVRLP